MMTNTWKLIAVTLFNLVVVVLAFLALEGLSNTILVASKVLGHNSRLAERLHTEYDETLGWINLPNTYIGDMYGPGIYLQTNGQRFRSNEDFSLEIPKEKARIVCSGDSFTLGYGVDNDHAWCQLLGTIDRQLETVNMGQGGYGIDQAYLWYKRDGVALDLDIHILAFITSDFIRMQSDEFQGYPKPILEIDGAGLVARTTPVPTTSTYRIWLSRTRPIINRLSTTKLLHKLLFEKAHQSNDRDRDQASKTDDIGASQTTARSDEKNDQTRKVALEIFRDLQHLSKTKDSVFVLVYLPTKRDYRGDAAKAWRQFLHAEASKHNLLLIDLIGEFRKLPPEVIDEMFIAEGAIEFWGAAGHYTEEGNAYVARALYDKLLGISEISEKLEP